VTYEVPSKYDVLHLTINETRVHKGTLIHWELYWKINESMWNCTWCVVNCF